MQRVNGNQFYALSTSVHPLLELRTEETILNVVWVLYQARLWLEYLLEGKIVPLRVSRPAVRTLLADINLIVPRDFPRVQPERGQEQLGYRAQTFAAHARDFETVLGAELQDIDTYFIEKKGIYVTSDLIDHADMALDEATQKTIPQESLRDFREAGKCLAFDLATASGFHSMRATESVLRQWHQLVCKPPPKADKPDMGKCVSDLRGSNPDKGALGALGVVDQIRELHRNPVMHPEDFLTVEQALRLFDIAKSAIGAMAEQIAKVPRVPPAAVASTAPGA